MGSAEDKEQHRLVTEILKEWQSDEDLVRRASSGKLANVTKPKNLSRRDVGVNSVLLAPIIKHAGT